MITSEESRFVQLLFKIIHNYGFYMSSEMLYPRNLDLFSCSLRYNTQKKFGPNLTRRHSNYRYRDFTSLLRMLEELAISSNKSKVFR